jgi:hypothetical protein
VVLDRIEDDKGDRRPADPIKLGADRDWTERIIIRLGPHPGLSEVQAAAIRDQYGIKGEALSISVRRCQVVYFLKRYQLEEPITLKAPHQAPLVLLNRTEVVGAIPPGMRVPLEPEATVGSGKLMSHLLQALPDLSAAEILERALASLLAECIGEKTGLR